MKKRFLYLLFASGVVISGCFKDKGNYDYSDINKITINSDSSTINVLLPDRLKIKIAISQTHPGPEGLGYKWVLFPNTQAPLTRRTLDTTANLDALITEDPGSYLLDLFVMDKKTGVEFQKRFSVNVITALGEGWVVLEEKGNGCDLGIITPVDVIFRDVYSKGNNGALLPPGSFRLPLIKTNRNIQSMYVLSPANAAWLNPANLLKISEFSSLFFQAPNPPQPQEYFMNGDEEVMLNNGKPHCRNLVQSGVNKLSLPQPGNYYMAPYEMYSIPTSYMWYDTIGQRFYKQNPTNFTLLPFPSDPADPFDMNNIGKRILHAEDNTGGNYFAFFKNNNDDSLFAYKFSIVGARPPVAVYAGLNAPGMLTAKKFLLSKSLPYLYYASGNSIYKLDILAQTAAPIYTFPAGTEIRAMKMYRNLKVFNDPNNNKLIAVATLEGGSQGKVYYFPLASTGNFTGNTYSKVFGGFGKINDIVFKSLK